MSENTELEKSIRAALAKVIDPELRKPITELNMVKGISVADGGAVHVEIYLTTDACPKKTEITERVVAAVTDVPGTGAVKVSLDVMNDEQRTALRKQLRGDQGLSAEPVIPFAQPGSLTRVYAVASGKGGVGKSSVTVNLAAALAARENKSDIIGGMDLSDARPDVADILISLAQRATKNNSAFFADLLVLTLGDRVHLLQHTHRFAGFAVLKAPDIPSVLVEIGFLSHPKEEKLLQSKIYREKVIAGIAAGIDSYFARKKKR